MACKAPGKHYREGLSTRQFFKLFPDDKAAEEWFIKRRWPEEICCHYCGSVNVNTAEKHKTMPCRCRDCRKRFSVKTGTFMQSSKIGYQAWLYAFYLFATNLKSISSMKLHRELGITQKAAWHMAHRIRQAWKTGEGNPFHGPVEVDEAYFGGKRRNMSNKKRKELAGTGRGSVGKAAVVGMKDRQSKQVSAEVVPNTTAQTLQGFVHDRIELDTMVYTDAASPYVSLENHESVRHSHQEYVRGDVHTNGVESFWSLLKRAHTGTFHKISEEHLHRYVSEFAGRHNMRELDTLEQMAEIVSRMEGKRLRYKDLVA